MNTNLIKFGYNVQHFESFGLYSDKTAIPAE